MELQQAALLWNVALTLLFSYFASLGLTGILIKTLGRHGNLDVPNERSMHKVPVPRGAGLAVVTIMAVIFGWLMYQGRGTNTLLQWFCGGFAIVAIVSWLDDTKNLHPAFRLAAHLFATGMVVFHLPDDVTITRSMLPIMSERILMVLFWSGFINIVNFMDGIDGITGAEIGCLAIGLLLYASFSPWHEDHAVMMITMAGLAGACAGFLRYNWHPARIFLGDVGSIPMGYIVGYFLLIMLSGSDWYIALILPLYYLADGGITLLRRLLRGEKIWLPHREHFYQKAALQVVHDKIVLWVVITNIILFFISLLAMQYSPWIGLLALPVVATLLRKMHKA